MQFDNIALVRPGSLQYLGDNLAPFIQAALSAPALSPASNQSSNAPSGAPVPCSAGEGESSAGGSTAGCTASAPGDAGGTGNATAQGSEDGEGEEEADLYVDILVSVVANQDVVWSRALGPAVCFPFVRVLTHSSVCLLSLDWSKALKPSAARIARSLYTCF